MPESEYHTLTGIEKATFHEEPFWHDLRDWQCPAEADYVKPLDFITYCNTHQYHYYVRQGCMGCVLGIDPPKVRMTMKEHAWAGWYSRERYHGD